MSPWTLTFRAVILATLFLMSAAGSATAEPGTTDIIDTVLDAEMPASGAPGVAYAVVDKDLITAAGARGVTRMGDSHLVTPDTPFLTGSVSKSFTALAVMQLVEAGAVDLDTGVGKYVREFSGEPAGAITVRQLLSHTSGLTTMQGNESPAELTASTVLPVNSPGQIWEYSNLNYQILGRLIEEVSQQDFQSYVTTNILEPVGMTNSFVSDGMVHESMANGHTSWFTTKRSMGNTPTDSATAPQGGIVSTAHDMALYMQMMMNGQDDILSAEGKALMMRPASAVSPSYGLGWFIEPDGGVWHTGTSPGFESLAWMYPAQQTGAIVLVNATSGLGFRETTQLRTAVAAAGLGVDYSGEGPRWFQKALLIGLVLLPCVYLISMVWAWRHRAALRAKSGVSGKFSLWFPLFTTSVAAWVILILVPRMFGTPLENLYRFQPDVVMALVATAVMGVVWSVFRLLVALITSTVRK